MLAPTLPQREANLPGFWYPSFVPVSTGPILVATDDTTSGDSAFRAAAAIAEKLAATVEVVIVVDPLPVLVPEPSIPLQPLVVSPELMSASRDRILARTRPLAPAGLEWHVEVEYGRPSTEITDLAHTRHVRLIVIGHVHHGVVDRLLDGDTALEVVRKSRAPVLLVSQDWKGLPKRAVFAVDFSVQSMEAARVALRLMSDTSTIVLAHVRQPVTVFENMGMWEEEYDEAAKKELNRFAEALNAPVGMTVEQKVLSGNPSATLLDFAQRTDADLVVAGTRGAGLMQRLLVGSVATRLMHHSTRSLLIVPDIEDQTEAKQ